MAKVWYLSRTVWGAIACIVSGVGQLVGVDIDQEQLSTALVQVSGPVSAVIGGLVAVWGRGQAKGGIEWRS